MGDEFDKKDEFNKDDFNSNVQYGGDGEIVDAKKKRNPLLIALGIVYALCFVGLFVLTNILMEGFELYEILFFALAFAVSVSEFFALIKGRKHIAMQLLKLLSKEENG